MKEDILNYSPTVMFRGPPYINKFLFKKTSLMISKFTILEIQGAPRPSSI